MRVIVLGLASALSLASPGAGEKRKDDSSGIPPVPTGYVPKKTAWGDPDFRAIWSGDRLPYAGIDFERGGAEHVAIDLRRHSFLRLDGHA